MILPVKSNRTPRNSEKIGGVGRGLKRLRNDEEGKELVSDFQPCFDFSNVLLPGQGSPSGREKRKKEGPPPLTDLGPSRRTLGVRFHPPLSFCLVPTSPGLQPPLWVDPCTLGVVSSDRSVLLGSCSLPGTQVGLTHVNCHRHRRVDTFIPHPQSVKKVEATTKDISWKTRAPTPPPPPHPHPCR